MEIIPAILAQTPEAFAMAYERLRNAGVKRIHLDICDGAFVATETISGFQELASLDTGVKFDVHLMVQRPEAYVDHWHVCTCADRFIVHVEATDMMQELADHAHGHGNELVVALNPDTPLERIEAYQQSLDAVQFMAVHPGLQGQSFLSDVVPKIRRFHAQYPEMPIMVDGGITPVTASVCAQAGASLLVSGSYVLGATDIRRALLELEASVV